MGDPRSLPGFVETIAPYLPTRGAAELTWAAVSGFDLDPVAIMMLGVWTLRRNARRLGVQARRRRRFS